MFTAMYLNNTYNIGEFIVTHPNLMFDSLL